MLSQEIHSAKTVAKEIFIDIISLAYSLSNTALYWNSVERFISYLDQNNDEKNKFDNAPSIINSLSMIFFFVSHFCTFSQTNSKFFDFQLDSKWMKIKNKVRNVTKIPTPVIKTFAGSASLFLAVHNSIGIIFASLIAGLSGIGSIFSQFSLFGSKLEVEGRSDFDKNEKLIKYFLIHLSTLLFALSNTTLYFYSILNLPEKCGLFTTHTDSDGTTEDKVFYPFLWFFTTSCFLST